MPRTTLLLGIALGLAFITSCSAAPGGGTDGNAGSAGQPDTGTGGQGGSINNTGAGDVGGNFAGPGGTGGGSGINCDNVAGVDDDSDGFLEDVDCNDCDPNVNPGAVEVIAEPDMNGMTPAAADEDCDGQTDNVVESCDAGLLLGNPDPYAGAKAIELCQTATYTDQKWGVLEALYVRADGSSTPPPDPRQWGIKPNYGPNVNVQGGENMLVLSAGYARDTSDADGCGSTTCQINYGGNAPAGFPQDVPNCSGSSDIHDDVALQLKIRTPKNATGYSFNFKFYSFEFPEWVCTSFNDQFIALVNPPPAGSINGNVSFDSNTNPVSVNIAFFDVCNPASAGDWAASCFGGCPPLPSPYCPSGTNELIGTGFLEWDGGSWAGGTSWLKTQAPVTGGSEMVVRFAIWDTGDQALDSTAVIDNFQWIANGGTVDIGTGVIPDPK